MRVFISWSKDASRELATILRAWLPTVIQQVDPWMSAEDIGKGGLAALEINDNLNKVANGLLCVTARNQREPWLNYEAGALARAQSVTKVWPVLLDLRPSDLTGPISQFQATDVRRADDMFRLFRDLNAECEHPLDEARLKDAFERVWPVYAKRVEAIDPSMDGRHPAARPADDVLREVLDLVRQTRHESRFRDSRKDFAVALPGGDVLTRGDLVHQPELGLGRVAFLRIARGTSPTLVGVRFADGIHYVPPDTLTKAAETLFPAFDLAD
jgi:TIR domain